ncbi:DNA recombination protein RmuC [Aquariibacter albus]|nr:DNA recombination protein RmuC [Aquariibacter albus]
MQQTLLTQAGDVARTQNEQIDSFRAQLATMQQSMADTLAATTRELTHSGQTAREAQDAAFARLREAVEAGALRQAQAQTEAQQAATAQIGAGQQRLTEALSAAQAQAAEAQLGQLRQLGEQQAQRLNELRQTVEQRLAAVQAGVEQRLASLAADNEKKLEQMRATVDEKLHATLEARLGESFKQVADRLEQVHKGLGEMQGLARDVGSLNRVLSNVKTRGIFGEVQLAGLLEQVFTPEQYATHVATVPGSSERVEFALRLPGRSPAASGAEAPIWLPIDAKFPREDYERLLEAHERADAPAVEAAAKAIEARLRAEARSIRDKYVAPPHTTDFAILFVPTEGLYAEALRRPGLVEALQREFKVMLAGPTTLLAVLNSLQMGFRTLALEKRSAEVWEVLGAVKTEFGKFGAILEKTRKKIDEAGKTLDDAGVRTRAMDRRLRSVEALPEARAAELLPGLLQGGLDEADTAPEA